MENLKSAVNLLSAVYENMNQISVVGIENQDRFVGCANAIQTVSQTLVKYIAEAEAKEPTVLQESGTAKELAEQEEVNGR